MAWRDQLRPASFRGVPFKVDSHSYELGRRLDVHEYPLRDGAWPEDLGAMTQRWRLEAYVIGPDYMAGRDALLAALKTKGPGVLVHPWLGTITVCLEGSATLTEGIQEGGMAAFSIPFVEAGADVTPSITVDTAEAAADAGAGVKASTVAAAPKAISVAGMPGFVASAAGDVLAQARAAIDRAVAGLAPAVSALGDLVHLGDQLLADANALLAAPASLAGRVIELVGRVRSLAGNPLTALPALRSLMGFGGTLSAVLGSTPARNRQRANQAALVAMIRRAAAAEAVTAVSQIAFTSYDQAAEIRDSLAASIDDLALQAGDAGDDDAFVALGELRGALIRDVTARGGSLARVFAYQPRRTEPALVIAYRVYGDAGRDLELVARNRLEHPGFVSAARPLEVLSPNGGDS